MCGTECVSVSDAFLATDWFSAFSYKVETPSREYSTKKYPVHLFLHGAGERGNDNESQLIHGSNLFLKENNRKKYPSFVIFPQSPKNDWWGGHYDPYKFDYQVKNSKALKLVINLMDEFIMRSDVNKNKIYVKSIYDHYFLKELFNIYIKLLNLPTFY